MIPRILFWLVIWLIGAVSVFYLLFSQSYQKSITAKAYFTFGEYKEANKLAKEAFALDRYNKMAITVMSQSAINMGFIDFIELAKEYRSEIESMVAKGVSEEERIRVKLICEIVLGKFKEVKSKTIMSDKDAVKKAQELNDWFADVYTEAYTN